MVAPATAKRWLDKAGFRNYCFVSYPHISDQVTEFAEKIQVGLRTELENFVSKPIVYLDKHIPPGADWPEDLRQNLCTSVAMVAILTPIYLENEHEWCGREWAAMAGLGELRMPNSSLKPIIPVFFRPTELPHAAGARQPIDLSRVSLQGRRYYSTQAFSSAILRIKDQVIEIGRIMHDNRVYAKVDGFVLPERSVFRRSRKQAPPLRVA